MDHNLSLPINRCKTFLYLLCYNLFLRHWQSDKIKVIVMWHLVCIVYIKSIIIMMYPIFKKCKIMEVLDWCCLYLLYVNDVDWLFIFVFPGIVRLIVICSGFFMPALIITVKLTVNSFCLGIVPYIDPIDGQTAVFLNINIIQNVYKYLYYRFTHKMLHFHFWFWAFLHFSNPLTRIHDKHPFYCWIYNVQFVHCTCTLEFWSYVFNYHGKLE